MHVGTARTALFNWLYARARGGKFLLRIEDTDRERSTPEATDAILRGMKWLGLDYDGEAYSQFARRDRHTEVAHILLAQGHAYKCFSTQEEIATFRDTARAAGQSTLFHSPWRDADASTFPDAPFVVRLKAPQSGDTLIQDEVQGDVRFKNALLDDMILLRSDGTPVYMLAVVVDDYDMGVTHVIRGDDHLANTPRQSLIYKAMGWELPIYAHIPLIHGPDGKKLSKRHGALGVEEYQAMGYPAAGLSNYLTRLGWSHGDDEFFTTQQALEWFDTDGIGKGAARFDFKKLENICGQHMAISEDAALLQEIIEFLEITCQPALTSVQSTDLSRSLYCLKDRAKTLPELLDKANFILKKSPLDLDERAAKALDSVSRGILMELTPHLQNATWSREALESTLSQVAEAQELKLGKLAGPLRAALSGSAASPSAFDMMMILGREETISRIKDIGGEKD
ncbi:UNVERIFIED_CONTAM: hypothetical protein GTU68_055446 [Idotea baltica]|nr:hypothetical protein [Idotea baltica]